MPRCRIQVTVTPQMRVALGLLANKSGLTVSSQATVTLRQALDRTINSSECQSIVGASQAFRTVREWRYDRAAEREVHNLMERADA